MVSLRPIIAAQDLAEGVERPFADKKARQNTGKVFSRCLEYF